MYATNLSYSVVKRLRPVQRVELVHAKRALARGPLPQPGGAFDRAGALGGTRTPNLLIRSQMLYPLSYERLCPDSLRHDGPALYQAFPDSPALEIVH